MKNSLIRGFVVALAIVGFTASSVAASHATPRTSTPRTSRIGSAPQTSGSTPLCAPSDPTHCGMD